MTALRTGLRHELPALPAPVELELELTNRCNAACVACPRSDMPDAGVMSRSTFDLLLDAYDAVRADHPLNRLLNRPAYPRVTLAGGGDPLLHPDVAGLVRHATDRGYSTHLITNGAAFTDARIDTVLESGVASVCFSFWGIERAEYEAAMKLPFERTLARVERFAAGAREAGIPVVVTWVQVPEVTSTRAEIAAFWDARGIPVDLTDNHMWNRGGLTRLPESLRHDPELQLPDTSRRVWCADLYFSDTWSWDGKCLLCCCNYFTSEPQVVGDIRADGAAVIAARKAALLAGPLPAMCRVCLQPRRKQSAWLGEPWKPFLTQVAWDDLTYAPRRKDEVGP